MKNKLLLESPNLKVNLFVLFFSFLSLGFSQNESRFCGNIESFEFTNGNESTHVDNNGTYDISELPDNFYLNAEIHGYSQSLRYKVQNMDSGETFEIVENILPYTFPAGNGAWDIGTGTFKVTATLYFRDGGRGWYCDRDIIIFTITESDECLAHAGTLTATETQVCSTGEVTISAHPNGDAFVPEGFSTLFVLTQGEGLVIQQVGPSPEFTVTGGGDYTIHTLVYPNGLDLSIVQLGVTTGFDVNSLLIQGGGELCASLDVAGASVHITNPDAGTLTAEETSVTLSNGSAVIAATPNGDANQPEGYSTLFVLTSGEGLVIEQVGGTPEFTVTEAGDYTIHTFVYPTGLDLSVVQLGVTTGFDVNSLLVQGGGDLCAALDVPGAPIHVGEEECLADAGTLTATATQVCSTGEVTISAHPNGDAFVPEGFSTLFVLTQGEGLVIQQVGPSPEFTVTGGGDYTIHTLVYPNGLDLSIVQLGVTTGFDVNGLLIQGGGELCASLDVAGAPVHITNPDAGTLTAEETSVTLSNGSAVIAATPNGDANQPEGYSTLFVLTSGEGLVIEQVGGTPEFTVTEAGDYTIHTLVYPTGLDLSVVQLGVTTGFDVNSLLVQGGGDLCAALDVPGAPIHVDEEEGCKAFSGKLYSEDPVQCITKYEDATIYAEFVNDPIIPNGYQQLFVLTNAFTLTILDVSDIPEFTVSNVGFYRIHSLIYDPNTLDLSIVEFGVTTAFDILPLLVQGGGDICASLEVKGPVSLVITGFLCNIFDIFLRTDGSTNPDVDMVNNMMEEFDSYSSFEESLIKQTTETTVFPNPVKSKLNIKTTLLDNETINYSISDMQGRLLKRGVITTLTDGAHQLDVSNLNNGTYIVQLNSEFRNFTTKVQVH
ncbi:T9SS type A sorting domain-containing protein [Winogradskyella tangerina]|uniref:T9SS type A sorting domain-containing protein n=1 Tax=Winogradskyella tangerina TaxID=2023240 RepID=UPI000DBEA47D|nr:T9SS type A sorting domain-containing protein [Winogradskyella tangerina]